MQINLRKINMIPKKIHYCWFGPKTIPEQLLSYMMSWKTHCPDYEIKLWNEDAFDVTSHPFTDSAYKKGVYAFVSDYVRAYALYHEGGIYLDTDVELKLGLDRFLEHEAFSGFELRGSPITAVWGSKRYHTLAKGMLDYYEGISFKDGQEPNTQTISRILVDEFNINPAKNKLQVGDDGRNTIHIYPAEYFCLGEYQTYAIHHFYGSWIENKKISTSSYIKLRHKVDQLLYDEMGSTFILNALAKKLSTKDIILIALMKFYSIIKGKN